MGEKNGQDLPMNTRSFGLALEHTGPLISPLPSSSFSWTKATELQTKAANCAHCRFGRRETSV